MSRLVAVGDCVDTCQTWNPASVAPAVTFQYIDLSSVDRELKRITGAESILGSGAPSRARQLVKAGDVLVSTVRPNLNGVAVVPRELDGATASTGFTVLRARGDQVDRSYLFHWVKHPRFVDEMVRKATGASYPAVSDRIVRESLIPLPALAEQRRIATILDKADALRAKRREAIAKLDHLLQSVFLDMFGDQRTNPKGWSTARIDEVAECLDRFRKPVTAKDRVAGDVPYYGANGQQGWIDKPIFNEPLVLVAEDGGHFERPERGVAYRIDGPAWVNNHAHILRAKPDMVDTEYLHRALRHFDFMPYISGSTRAKLTQGQLNAVPILVPPIDLQRKFVRTVEDIQSQERLLQRSANDVEALFASLQHRAFTGTL